MSRIVQAINVMISNSKLITESTIGENGSEYFFIYDQKHVWSIYEDSNGTLYLTFYPGNQDIGHLASISNGEWEIVNIKTISYNSHELSTKEALDSLKELYKIAKEKVYGMEEILDEIISSDGL
jgi:hypothetical protein